MTEAERAIRPKPVASFVVDPPDPAAGQPVRLLDLSYDPGGDGIGVHAWDLGDGTTSLEAGPTHHFERDGVYIVTLHVTALDGRVGTASVPITVTTHDVALTRIVVPERAHVGDVGEVVVVVESRQGAEIVQVELLRRRGRAEAERVAIHTRTLAEAGVIEIVFPVSFDEADANAGRVRFYASVTIIGAADATPADNELSGPPTAVERWPV